MMRPSERPAPQSLGQLTAQERIKPLLNKMYLDQSLRTLSDNEYVLEMLQVLAEEIDDLQEMINDLDRSKEER
jgi:hypothetical protein